MRAVQFAAAGFEALSIVDLPVPEPGPYEVRLAMKAASCNFRDLIVTSGKYPSTKFPLVPLSDGVGIVEAVGAQVTRLKIGDRVCPLFSPRWLSGPPTDAVTSPALGGEIDGVLRQNMLVDEQAVVFVPDYLSDAEAATLPCAAVTAWSALVAFGQVKPGDTVLIEGTGGVSLFALQFAKLAGARVALISSSDEKLERGKALGADITLNYRDTPEWGAPIAKLTGGVDIVVETVGAATLGQALIGIKKGGRVAQIGLLSGVGASLPLQYFIPRGVTMQGILVGGRDRFEDMLRAMAMHKLRPVVTETSAFDQLPTALGKFTPGAGHFGKIVIEIPAK
jgi:NADPH:quinone reductase-like Zn-dependent oxidoreductase